MSSSVEDSSLAGVSGPYESWWHEADPDGTGIATVLDLREIATRGAARLSEHSRFGLVWIFRESILEVECDAARRELLTHLPLMARPARGARVLVVGGGDGAIPRALLEHGSESVSEIVLVDDADLVSLARARGSLPEEARLRTVAADESTVEGIRGAGRFDLVIVDRLPDEGALDAIAACVGRDTDVVIRDAPLLTRRGARWLARGHRLARHLRDDVRGGRLASAAVPSPFCRGGFHGFFVFTADGRDLSEPLREWKGRHYHPAAHRAAFALPAWWPDVDAPRLEAGSALGDPRGWWHEDTGEDYGVTQALALRRTHAVESRFQSIAVHEHPHCGVVLTLDDTVQLSTADDAIYHEMVAHVPLLSRRFEQASLLIVGGGDGGLLREVLRHDFVRRVVMVEIDGAVVEASRRHVGIEGDFDDPRVELVIDDGVKWLSEAAERGERFDVVWVDATDSTGPSAVLWNESFYVDIAAVLREDGICVDSDIAIPSRRGELAFSRDPCPFGILDLVRTRRPFAGAECYYTRVPLFPGGYFAFFVYSKTQVSSASPWREYVGRHYTPAVHRAAFALPEWWKRIGVNT